MFKTKKEKYEYLQKIFEDVSLFEWEVLHVTTSQDRQEVMEILSKTLVRDTIKEKVNFLYFKSLDDFDMRAIKPALFKEIVNEYMSFAVDVLYLDKEEVRKDIGSKASFMYAIIDSYMQNYNTLIYQEIVDTFIELAQTAIHSKQSLKIVQEVFDTILVVHKKMIAIQDVEHLLSKVRSAYNFKNLELSKFQVKVTDLRHKLEDETLEDEIRDNLLLALYSQEKKLENIENSTLEKYDAALQRLKHSMVQQLLHDAK
ncbi:MAG: hypothetical protein RBR54_01740 [Sulfurimonas sp.]|jgi:hypothetical protein|nr:hypothetical protein [Sulfurimonas sp.]